MLSGQPIETNKADIFERGGFANQIADLLVLPERSPSISIALEGVWGSGKTSAINLIKERLSEKAGDVVIVDFNPWLIGSLDSVIEGFLVQFASTINFDLKSDLAAKTASKLLNFAKFLAPIKLIPGVEPWGSLVERTLQAVGDSASFAVDMTELDLNKRKRAVRKAVDELGKPIVVIIDDVDRCPPREVRTIFQVIKAICDFNRVSYLLAYDPEPIVKCLEYDGTYDGHRYLEKIIQAAYPLPRIGYWHLKQFLNTCLGQLQDRLGLVLDETDKEILNQALDRTAMVRSLATPRDVTRLINRLLISAKNTAGEVNFADIVAFETLELKYSEISQAIRRKPEQFLGTTVIEGDLIDQDYLDEMTDDTEREKKGEPPFVQDLLRTYDDKDRKNVRSILNFLFPNTFDQWSPHSAEEASFHNRVSTKEALLKLLHGGPTKYTYSSEEIKHFLESTEDRHEILMDFLESGVLSSWLNFAKQFIAFAQTKDPVQLCKELLSIGRNAFVERRLNLTDEIGGFVLALLESEQNNDRKLNVIGVISSNDVSLSISEHVILRLLADCDMWDQGAYKGVPAYSAQDVKALVFNPNKMVEIKDAWIITVRKVVKDRNIFTSEPEPISILFRWGQLNDNNYAEVQEYLSSISNDSDTLGAFVRCFGGGKGLSGIENLIGNVRPFIDVLDKLDDPPNTLSSFIKYLKQVEKAKNQN